MARAVAVLASTPGVRVSAVSSLYGSRPEGGLDQPDYANAVVSLDTDLLERELFALGQRLEVLAGRTAGERNASRELDVDLLLYEDRVWDQADLVLPHPRMESRAFVLVPLAEIAPEARHPVSGKTAQVMAAEVSHEGLWCLAAGSGWMQG
jgi:2-amino-4-hydroxy-6-hydroxymethyldihydropteridine diphosphokinase